MKNLAYQSEPEENLSEEGFDVADILERRARVLRRRRKRVRTRAALVAAAARELADKGYESLTVEGITEAAGMARGTFYQYYRRRSDIAAVVMRYYWALVRIHRPRGGGGIEARQSVHRVNRFLVHLVRRNARLLRGRDTLMLDDPDLARQLEHLNQAWAARVLRDMIARGHVDPADGQREYHLLRVRGVIAMSDALLRDIYRGAEGAGAETDPDLVIRVMDDLWCSALYGPPPAV